MRSKVRRADLRVNSIMRRRVKERVRKGMKGRMSKRVTKGAAEETTAQ